MRDGVILFTALMMFGYGLFLVFWPEIARKQFLAQYHVETPPRMLRPNTWLTFRPAIWVFIVAGIVMICLSIFVLYVWKNG
jgi:uncharacterized membrane protein HdeD (DUF308 family)